MDVGPLHDQPGLAVLAEAAAEVQRHILLLAFRPLTPAPGRHAGDAQIAVPVPPQAGDLRMGADRLPRSGLKPKAQGFLRRAPVRGHQIDRPAQQGAAEAQGVAALVDLGVAGQQGVDHLHVAEAVGLVERDAVLRHEQAAQVVGIADARAADRDAHVAAPLLLGIDAGHVAQGVGDVGGVAVLQAFRRDHGHGTRGARQATPRLGYHGGVFGIAGPGDDDLVDLEDRPGRGLLGEGGGGDEGEGDGGGRAEKTGFHEKTS